jgi:hypothetical protein
MAASTPRSRRLSGRVFCEEIGALGSEGVGSWWTKQQKPCVHAPSLRGLYVVSVVEVSVVLMLAAQSAFDQ